MGEMRHKGKFSLSGRIELLKRLAQAFLSGAFAGNPFAFGRRCGPANGSPSGRIVEQGGDLGIDLRLLIGRSDLLDSITDPQ